MATILDKVDPDTITEKELNTAGANHAISTLRIAQLDNGKYSLVAKLNWRPAEVTLVTDRKQVRGWANLNTLIDHIREKYGIDSTINVTLKGERK